MLTDLSRSNICNVFIACDCSIVLTCVCFVASRPLVETYYGWDVFAANLLFTGAGLASLLAFVVVGIASTKVPDRVMVSWSLLLGILGFALLCEIPGSSLGVPQFLIGFFFISIAFPVGRATVIALYTKTLPLKWQGTGQGVILAVGAAARILGPFWAVSAFFMENGETIVFASTSCLFLCTLALFAFAFPSATSARTNGLHDPDDVDAMKRAYGREPLVV